MKRTRISDLRKGDVCLLGARSLKSKEKFQIAECSEVRVNFENVYNIDLSKSEIENQGIGGFLTGNGYVYVLNKLEIKKVEVIKIQLGVLKEL